MREQPFLIPEGDKLLCSLTNRVMMISPLPDRVQELLVALSGGCFDVFSLHDFNKGMLPALQPELIIYDALPLPISSANFAPEAAGDIVDAARSHGMPVLVLVDSVSYAELSDEGIAGAELLEWPMESEKALARIHRLLESRPRPVDEEILLFKDVRIDLRKMKVELAGARVELTKTEYDLLLYFLKSDGEVLTRERLLDRVWGAQFFGGSNIVDVHIKSLRKKLKDSAVSPRYIVTVRGAGYRLADELLH